MYRFPTHLHSQILVAWMNWRVLGHLSWPLGYSPSVFKVQAADENTWIHTDTLPRGAGLTCCWTSSHPLCPGSHNRLLAWEHLVCQCWSTPIPLSLSPFWWRAKAYLFPLGFRLIDTVDRTFQQLAFHIEFPRLRPKIHWMSLGWQLPLPGSSSIRPG